MRPACRHGGVAAFVVAAFADPRVDSGANVTEKSTRFVGAFLAEHGDAH